MSNNKAGVVILNYNDADNTLDLVRKICGYYSVKKILVVDNCSTDDSYYKIEKQLPNFEKKNIVLLKTDYNGGYAYGNNFGVRYLKKLGYDQAIICNTDVVFDENLVEQCCKGLSEGYAMTAAIMRMGNGELPLLNSYFIATYSQDLQYCSTIGRRALKRHAVVIKPDKVEQDPIEVQMVPGSMFFVDIDKFLSIGGFDEGTFLYCEERILGRRLLEAGYRIGLYKNVEYLHNHSTSINKSYSTTGKIRILYNSILYYQKKYNHIGTVKRFLLEIAMQVSLLEFGVRDRLAFLRKKYLRGLRKNRIGLR